ncbi:MAG: U32 family peptidase [Treponema sp.]|nr:U32 family peptidase [Treponema sp.]
MELLSPAGNVEKLYYAYAYGADAAYIGLKRFSLRVKADNFYEDEYKKVIELKKQFPGKRLHCALNISFHNRDIDNFIQNIDYFKAYPIDAFIVQDIGMVPILQKYFPEAELHVSTQASCVNREAVKMYKSMGFKRVVLGREVTLKEIRQIKDAVPDVELEAFAHGAMCIAYAGRCLMSAYLTARSAQAGACSHTCRWDFDVLADPNKAKAIAETGALVLEEKKRPGEYFPIYEGDDFTAVLSSKDLRMVEHLDDMIKAGVDSIKIEGRMKSVYYVALVTRAYRKALDALEGKITSEQAQPFVDELENVSHRESGTGFYYNPADANKCVSGATDSRYILAAEIVKKLDEKEEEKILSLGQEHKALIQKELDEMHPAAREARLRDYQIHPEKNPPCVEKKEGWFMYELKALNMIKTGDAIEFISPDVVSTKASSEEWNLLDPENGTEKSWVCDGHPCLLYSKIPLQEGALIRIEDPEYIPGKIRDSGR